MDLFVWVVLAFFLAFIPAAIAKGKGHSFVEWWIFGFLLFIVALPYALLMKPAAGFVERYWPFCSCCTGYSPLSDVGGSINDLKDERPSFPRRDRLVAALHVHRGRIT